MVLSKSIEKIDFSLAKKKRKEIKFLDLLNQHGNKHSPTNKTKLETNIKMSNNKNILQKNKLKKYNNKSLNIKEQH